MRLAGEQIAQLLFIKDSHSHTHTRLPAWPGQNGANMASGRIQTNKRIRKQFQRRLQMLLDTFHDTILLYTQDIQVVNFSDISRGFVNVIIMYKDVEGRSVKLEAMGEIGKDYVQTLDFLWQAMKRAAQEAPSDYSGPFSPLTLPTHNDLLKILSDLEL